MSFDPKDLAQTMIDAARAAAAEQWPSMREVAEPELRRLASSYADVVALHKRGAIDDSRAQQLAYMHQSAVRQVLKTVEGFGLYTAERIVSAATAATATVVNHLVGFKLL